MIERRIVRRYVTALFESAKEAGVIDRIESDLGLVAYAVEVSPDLYGAISSPVIPTESKKAIIKDVFEGNVHEITLHYLYLLVDKRREEAVKLTEEEYIRLANESRGILNVQVVTAVKINQEESAKLEAKLVELTGMRVHLTKVAIPEVLGGVMLRIGDKVIDGTIRGQLDNLKSELLS